MKYVAVIAVLGAMALAWWKGWIPGIGGSATEAAKYVDTGGLRIEEKQAFVAGNVKYDLVLAGVVKNSSDKHIAGATLGYTVENPPVSGTHRVGPIAPQATLSLSKSLKTWTAPAEAKPRRPDYRFAITVKSVAFAD